MSNALRAATHELLWAALPLRDVLRHEKRAAFILAWTRASQAFCTGHFKADKTPLQHARDEAVRLHQLSLEACAAFGVKGHELVPHYNARADGGFHSGSDPVIALAALTMQAARVAQALLDQQEAKEASHAATD